MVPCYTEAVYNGIYIVTYSKKHGSTVVSCSKTTVTPRHRIKQKHCCTILLFCLWITLNVLNIWSNLFVESGLNVISYSNIRYSPHLGDSWLLTLTSLPIPVWVYPVKYQYIVLSTIKHGALQWVAIFTIWRKARHQKGLMWLPLLDISEMIEGILKYTYNYKLIFVNLWNV